MPCVGRPWHDRRSGMEETAWLTMATEAIIGGGLEAAGCSAAILFVMDSDGTKVHSGTLRGLSLEAVMVL